MKETLRKLSSALDEIPLPVMITDAGGRIEYVNRKFEEVTGCARNEVLGGSGERFQEGAKLSPLRDDEGRITHYLAVREDHPGEKQNGERPFRQASYDELTGLPNRLLVLDRLGRALDQAGRRNRRTALIAVGLNRFSIVNDTLGHEVGDALLVEAGRRLVSAVGEGDTVARYGGAEFLVVLPELEESVHVEATTRRIVDAFAAPFTPDGVRVHLNVSLGVSVSPHDGTDPHLLLRNADAAMHRAKDDGINTTRFFTPQMKESVQARMRMEQALRGSVERGEMSLHYQPIVDLRTGKMAGAEALLRWHSPELGAIPPARFIPLAEETGLIGEITRWVLREAARDAAEWPDAGGKAPPSVAVNISSGLIRRGELVAAVSRALDEARLPPERLELEITERFLMDERPEVVLALDSLHRMGVRITLDDFGTGYSALSYLRSFRFDSLKMDRAFVKGVTRSRQDATLATAIIQMAHGLGLRVVAEGIETEAQLAFVREAECDLAQGYLFSHPLPAAEFRAHAAAAGARPVREGGRAGKG